MSTAVLERNKKEKTLKSIKSDVQDLGLELGVPIHELPLKRAISPLHDLVAVWRMRGVFCKVRFFHYRW